MLTCISLLFFRESQRRTVRGQRSLRVSESGSDMMSSSTVSRRMMMMMMKSTVCGRSRKDVCQAWSQVVLWSHAY